MTIILAPLKLLKINIGSNNSTHIEARETTKKSPLRQKRLFLAISISSFVMSEWVTWPKIVYMIEHTQYTNSHTHMCLRSVAVIQFAVVATLTFSVLSFIFQPGHSRRGCCLCCFFSVSFANGMQILFDFIWNMLSAQPIVLHNNSTKYTFFIVSRVLIILNEYYEFGFYLCNHLYAATAFGSSSILLCLFFIFIIYFLTNCWPILIHCG